MSIVGRADKSMSRCESELRELGAEALRAGDYESARLIAELAEAIADQRRRCGLDGSEAVRDRKPSGGASQNRVYQSPSVGDPAGGSSRKRPRTPSKKSGSYPLFVRRGEKLVKIGWSKKNKQEYEHSMPWSAALVFSRHLRSRVHRGRIFTVDELLPAPDTENQAELPGYQVYLAIAWLREMGLVEKRGRDGYTADPGDLDEKSLAQRWAKLPSRDH